MWPAQEENDVMQLPIIPGSRVEDGVFDLPLDLLAEQDPPGARFERLLSAMEQHVRGEASALGHYEQLAGATKDPAVELVMRLILEDEERHHGLLARIAATLRDALYWTHSPDALPSSRTPQEPLPGEWLNLVRALIHEERDGARALRDLAARERGINDGLDSLLLEMMALDSEKHARLLRFVERRLERRV
jgi:rubrerythrin